MIEILDELAHKEKITITAHQWSVLDVDLALDNTSIKLSEHFEGLREVLIGELREVMSSELSPIPTSADI